MERCCVCVGGGVSVKGTSEQAGTCALGRFAFALGRFAFAFGRFASALGDALSGKHSMRNLNTNSYSTTRNPQRL